MSSKNYRVFIGNDAFIREKFEYIKPKFNEYGMKFGWHGRVAYIYVDEDYCMSDENYIQFYEFAKKYDDDLKKIVANKKVGKGLLIGSIITTCLSEINAIFAAATPVLLLAGISTILQDNKIREQQYMCAVLAFYEDALDSFLKQKEES